MCQNLREKRKMTVNHKGELLKPKKHDGKMLRNEEKGPMLKKKKEDGNPLWKDTIINEDGRKPEKLNE